MLKDRVVSSHSILVSFDERLKLSNTTSQVLGPFFINKKRRRRFQGPFSGGFCVTQGHGKSIEEVTQIGRWPGESSKMYHKQLCFLLGPLKTQVFTKCGAQYRPRSSPHMAPNKAQIFSVFIKVIPFCNAQIVEMAHVVRHHAL